MSKYNFCTQNNKDDSFVFKVFLASRIWAVWTPGLDKNISMANVVQRQKLQGHSHHVGPDP